MRKNILLTALCTLLGSSSANAALIDNGGGLIYDNVLDITWTERDDVWQHDWYGATTYASDLVRGGSGDWRLPYASVAAMSGPMTASPVDCSTATELACRDNELGYMLQHNLGGRAAIDSHDWSTPYLGLFDGFSSRCMSSKVLGPQGLFS